MNPPSALLARLDAIGASLAQSAHALALIGLGSVGLETERLDAFSDLDFFVIVAEGYRARYLDNLDWLGRIAPLAYYFRNTADGYKLLFQDGIFCEFAVFELAALNTIPFARGRIVWKQPAVPDRIAIPSFVTPHHAPPDREWLIGEALTNLYVGLARFRRGEKLAAARLIQSYAVDRVVELVPFITSPTSASPDEFAHERRLEQRYPDLARELPNMLQGYGRSVESALAILDFLERHWQLNAAMVRAIRQLATAVA